MNYVDDVGRCCVGDWQALAERIVRLLEIAPGM